MEVIGTMEQKGTTGIPLRKVQKKIVSLTELDCQILGTQTLGKIKLSSLFDCLRDLQVAKSYIYLSLWQSKVNFHFIPFSNISWNALNFNKIKLSSLFDYLRELQETKSYIYLSLGQSRVRKRPIRLQNQIVKLQRTKIDPSNV